jgi:hypothetical protein
VLNLLAPLRKPSLELLNIAFVINRKADVRAPDAASPARKDCNNKTITNLHILANMKYKHSSD